MLSIMELDVVKRAEDIVYAADMGFGYCDDCGVTYLPDGTATGGHNCGEQSNR
jgi:hypothetical protein